MATSTNSQTGLASVVLTFTPTKVGCTVYPQKSERILESSLRVYMYVCAFVCVFVCVCMRVKTHDEPNKMVRLKFKENNQDVLIPLLKEH